MKVEINLKNTLELESGDLIREHNGELKLYLEDEDFSYLYSLENNKLEEICCKIHKNECIYEEFGATLVARSKDLVLTIKEND